jgi:hypothetical protein
MCGLVALCGPVPVSVAETAIAGARRRGPHQSGWAVLDPDFGQWQLEWSPEPLAATTLQGPIHVGHSRLATTSGRPGDAPPLHEAQPYCDATAGVVIAHNGTCPKVHARHPGILVDTMALLVEDGGVPALARLLANEDAPQAAIVADVDGRVWTIRTGRVPHPLYRLDGDGWLAISSGPMAAGSRLVPAGVWQR